jgi:3-hydroxyisobutyrate dehydrogenase-like beta-hydroxyacid dehydrogenase
MLANVHASLFPVDLALKDLGYAVGATGGRPLTAAARDVFAQASAAHLGGLHLTAVARLYG